MFLREKEYLRKICFLYYSGIIHRDLKLDNILLSVDNTIKICDFGQAKDTNVIPDPNDPKSYTVLGTTPYTPPEVWRTGNWEFKGDIWSFGVVVYRLYAYPEYPYPVTDDQERDIQQPSLQLKRDMECSKEFPIQVHSFVHRCLVLDVPRRAEITELQALPLCVL